MHAQTSKVCSDQPIPRPPPPRARTQVYQENVWVDTKKFVSFKKVVHDMGHGEGSSQPLQLMSFHSISKGFSGECGLRGGYVEMQGIHASVAAQLYKFACISLCSNTVGQLGVGLMCHPPPEGTAASDVYVEERDAILGSMKRRVVKITGVLNSMEGVSCQPIEGSMYAFPSLTIPPMAAEAAAAEGQQPDSFYCMQALESTGIVMVPGNGFKQVPGTAHLRTTFLPPEEQIDKVVERLGNFHKGFMDRYRGAGETQSSKL